MNDFSIKTHSEGQHGERHDSDPHGSLKGCTSPTPPALEILIILCQQCAKSFESGLYLQRDQGGGQRREHFVDSMIMEPKPSVPKAALKGRNTPGDASRAERSAAQGGIPNRTPSAMLLPFVDLRGQHHLRRVVDVAPLFRG